MAPPLLVSRGMSLTADASRLCVAAEGERRGWGGSLLLEEVEMLTAEDGARKREGGGGKTRAAERLTAERSDGTGCRRA